MIGASNLYELAAKLEKAAEACDEKKIRQIHDDVMEEYLSLAKDISKVIEISDCENTTVDAGENEGNADFEIFMEFDVDTEAENDDSE